jgi:hypothetical protein
MYIEGMGRVAFCSTFLLGLYTLILWSFHYPVSAKSNGSVCIFNEKRCKIK